MSSFDVTIDATRTFLNADIAFVRSRRAAARIDSIIARIDAADDDAVISTLTDALTRRVAAYNARFPTYNVTLDWATEGHTICVPFFCW